MARVRADRLVAILLMLQSRGQVTAAEVAEELEISERTARRDLEALGMAGLPIYSRQGRNGGWRLAGGGRTDLSGLNAAEARALFLVAGPASSATPELRAALRKLVRALPESFRTAAEAATTSVLVDPPGWDQQAPRRTPIHLEAVQQAVVDGEQIVLGYVARDRTATTRVVHPLGLAAKGAVWYLVGDTEAGLRTFRVDRMTSVEPNGQPVSRPDGFDLHQAWKLITEEVESKRTPIIATALRDAGFRAHAAMDPRDACPHRSCQRRRADRGRAARSQRSFARGRDRRVRTLGRGPRSSGVRELLGAIGTELADTYPADRPRRDALAQPWPAATMLAATETGSCSGPKWPRVSWTSSRPFGSASTIAGPNVAGVQPSSVVPMAIVVGVRTCSAVVERRLAVRRERRGLVLGKALQLHGTVLCSRRNPCSTYAYNESARSSFSGGRLAYRCNASAVDGNVGRRRRAPSDIADGPPGNTPSTAGTTIGSKKNADLQRARPAMLGKQRHATSQRVTEHGDRRACRARRSR